jgi:hypothetical protein
VVIWEKWRFERYGSRGIEKLLFGGIYEFLRAMLFDKPVKINFHSAFPMRISGMRRPDGVSDSKCSIGWYPQAR